jgi:ribosomal protein S6--L-glutamate ligase
MRIGLLAEWLNPTIEQTMDLLAQGGATITVIYPDKQLLDLAALQADHDLYLLKSSRDGALSVGGALHLLGAALLNPYPPTDLLRNKAIVARALQAAGLPTPATYMVTDPADLVPLLEDGPLMFKPYRGSRGEGVRVLWRPHDLAELGELPAGEPIMVQRYHQPDGPDYKLFGIGSNVLGVKRVWPLRSYQDKHGEPFTPSPELLAIALTCRRTFDVDLYGVDVVLSEGRPYVVDVNSFPGYAGVPDAPRLLADFIFAAGERALRGEPVMSVKRVSSLRSE